MIQIFKKLMKIFLSLIVSFIFIYIAGFLLCDSPIYYVYNEQLKKFIHSPGIVYKHRSEGFGETYKGLYGINAIRNISIDKRKKIAVWGDSFIEAHQVDDNFKIPQIITSILSKKGLGDQLMCFGIGMSGDSVADYYFDMPKYETVAENIIMHFIVITSIEDILPNQPSDDTRGLFRSNPLNFYMKPWEPKHQKIKKILYDLNIYFLWEPVRSAILSGRKLRFIPGKIEIKENISENQEKEFSEKQFFESWNFLCEKLREQTTDQIVFVYCPDIPRIENGMIKKDDKDANSIEQFSEIAGNYGIDVINTADDLLSFYKKTGVFPRGFPNSRPSRGHFNKYGHKIVANAISLYIINQYAR